MGNDLNNMIENVTNLSNEFETNNSDLKRRYFIRNIYAFNYLVSLVNVNRGSFGTGYPFYVLQRDLTGKIPIINEQIRYNNELIKHAKNSNRDKWTCESCLTENYDTMPDLKQICKPCPNMDDELKPRKIMNRLPDVDMWMICRDGHVEEAQEELKILLDKYGIHTSDVNPMQTIKDLDEITQSLKNGVMPRKFLPIDAHIIEYSRIKELIQRVPHELEQADNENRIPYLPIHPKSYRKTWQYDDTAYNFIYDFLSTFAEFNFDSSLDKVLTDTRSTIVKRFSSEQLHRFMLQSATEPSRRRNETIELYYVFSDKIKSWKERAKELGNHSDPDDQDH